MCVEREARGDKKGILQLVTPGACRNYFILKDPTDLLLVLVVRGATHTPRGATKTRGSLTHWYSKEGFFSPQVTKKSWSLIQHPSSTKLVSGL